MDKVLFFLLVVIAQTCLCTVDFYTTRLVLDCENNAELLVVCNNYNYSLSCSDPSSRSVYVAGDYLLYFRLINDEASELFYRDSSDLLYTPFADETHIKLDGNNLVLSFTDLNETDYTKSVGMLTLSPTVSVPKGLSNAPSTGVYTGENNLGNKKRYSLEAIALAVDATDLGITMMEYMWELYGRVSSSSVTVTVSITNNSPMLWTFSGSGPSVLTGQAVVSPGSTGTFSWSVSKSSADGANLWIVLALFEPGTYSYWKSCYFMFTLPNPSTPVATGMRVRFFYDQISPAGTPGFDTSNINYGKAPITMSPVIGINHNFRFDSFLRGDSAAGAYMYHLVMTDMTSPLDQ